MRGLRPDVTAEAKGWKTRSIYGPLERKVCSLGSKWEHGDNFARVMREMDGV